MKVMVDTSTTAWMIITFLCGGVEPLKSGK